MNGLVTQSVLGLLVTVFIVYRFARRELQVRTLRARTLWIRPAIMIALTAYLIVLSSEHYPLGDVEMLLSLAAGAVLGLIVGIAIVRNTHFEPAPVPGAVVVRGNRVTFMIWIGALALRLLARYLVPHGGDPLTQLPLNCGTVVMTAVAFCVIALAFWSAIRRYAATIGAPEAIVPGTTTRQ